jgi:hypothetical protein
VNRFDISEPEEKAYTTWRNPLPYDQRVILTENGRRVKYTIASGKETRIPSIFDVAIQSVLCSDPHCREKGGFCRRQHEGRIVSGLAPQLIHVDRRETAILDPALDTERSKREQAAAELAAAELARKAADNASLVAAKRLSDLETAAGHELSSSRPSKR